MTGEAQPDGSGAADDEGRREIEWQLSAPDLGLVRKWLSDHGSVDGLTIEPRPTRTIDDTYRGHRGLASAAGRVRAAHARRSRARRGDAEGSRSRVGLPAEPARVQRTAASANFEALAAGSGPVSTRVHAVAGPEPLKALFRVRTQRECFVALEQGDQQAAEIALDDTIVAAPDGGPSDATDARRGRGDVRHAGIARRPGRSVASECALTPRRGQQVRGGTEGRRTRGAGRRPELGSVGNPPFPQRRRGRTGKPAPASCEPGLRTSPPPGWARIRRSCTSCASPHVGSKRHCGFSSPICQRRSSASVLHGRP